jgi:curved DNA-binding protein CbpA
MFVDYYKILEIEINSTQQEIKAAFRKQAIKWHPDKNPNVDVNEKMQLINEAYLILKDEEARIHYDIEHKKFYDFYNSRKQQKSNSDFGNNEKQKVYEEYNFNDETLPFPTLKINPDIKNIDDFKYGDFELVNYQSHPALKGEIANIGGF